MIKTLLSPLLFALFFLLIGLAIMSRRWKKLQRAERCSLLILVFGTTVLIVSSLPVTALWMAESLENQYRNVARIELGSIDVVVVLAAGLTRNEDPLLNRLNNTTYYRTAAGVRAFKMSDARLIVMSGGSRIYRDTLMTDAMRVLAIEMGVPAENIMIEPLSRNTFQHPRELLKLKGVKPSDKIGVATSAWHMPRAMGEFKRYFPNSIAVPCCDQSRSVSNSNFMIFVPTLGSAKATTVFMHEHIGSLWYKIKHVWDQP